MPTLSNITMTLGVIGLAGLGACSSWDTRTPHTQYSQTAQPVHREMTSGMVQQVQTSLAQQGIYRGTVDGVWGPVTQTAVQTYQQSHGLMANGQIDQPTLASLNLPTDGTMPNQVATPAPVVPTPVN